MKKVLFIAAHRPDRSPSQRFRFEQYIDFLSQNGFACDFSYILSAADDAIYYAPGNYFRKAFIALKSAVKRLGDVRKARQYDILFVQREAFMLGTTFFERRMKASGVKMIFDFDDSIWLQDVSTHNRHVLFLKHAGKTSELITMSAWVIAGNKFLADYAHRYNQNVSIIPTTIDTHRYQPGGNQKGDGTVTIGWSGSFSTVKHFETILPVLLALRKIYGTRVAFVLIGDASYRFPPLAITGKAWRKETEVADLLQFDIGIMPLPDDAWSKGKCGLKGLQYMALEIPTVMSPVGVNMEILVDGENGFLAGPPDEWIQKLGQLIESPSLRALLGKAGRRTVVERFSVESQKQNYLQLFQHLTNQT